MLSIDVIDASLFRLRHRLPHDASYNHEGKYDGYLTLQIDIVATELRHRIALHKCKIMPRKI